MTRSNVLTEYTNPAGQLVTVYKPRKVRKHERTWTPFSKFSLYQMGHQGAALGVKAAAATVDQIGQESKK